MTENEINSWADMLAHDIPFAKVVSTDRGEALLLGGCVFHVSGPDGLGADVLSRAMRRSHRQEPQLQGGAAVMTASEVGGLAN